MKNKFLYISVLSLTFLPIPAIAQDAQCKGAKAVGGDCTSFEFNKAIENITSTLFYIIGAISVIFLLIGAIRYITSTGDASRIKQAKDTIFYALAGVIIAIVAQAIIAFVISEL